MILEVLEAADMKPSDLNGMNIGLLYFCQIIRYVCLTAGWSFSGLADPYVKGNIGLYRFRTKTKKKTLTPQWHEEFKIPVCTWESPNNMLNIEVRDKDRFIDDTLGFVLLSSWQLKYLRLFPLGV